MSLWNVQTSLVLSTFEGNTATTRKGTRGLTVRRLDRREAEAVWRDVHVLKTFQCDALVHPGIRYYRHR
jgi:hypothetical protein